MIIDIDNMDEKNSLAEQNRISWHNVYIEILQTLIRRCSCLKLKTAAIIVKDTQIIALGYNGTFAKHIECDSHWREVYRKKQSHIPFEDWLATDEFRLKHREWSKVNEIHAESNALRWLSRDVSQTCVMYTLYSPCSACTKEIIAHGVKTVYYKHKYKHGDHALITLWNADIPCIQII